MKKIFYGILLVLLLFPNAWARESPPLSVEVLAKASSSWNGQVLPEYNTGQPEVTILKIIIPPKTQLVVHQHPVINAGVLIRGELTVITEAGQTLNLKAGDPIVEVVDTWHYGKNEGSESAEIIVFYAGIAGEPVTIKKQPPQ